MDRSRHSITQYTDDGKTQTAKNEKIQETAAYQLSTFGVRACQI